MRNISSKFTTPNLSTRPGHRRWGLPYIILLGALACAVLAWASQTYATIPPIAGVISSINANRGIAVARVVATGRTFEFNAPRKLILQLKVGQQVTVDFQTGLVSVAGAPGCCHVVVRVPRPTGLGGGGGGSQGAVFVTKQQALDAYRSNCDGVSTSSNRVCVPQCTLTTSGSSPGTEDDEYSCTCVCN